MLFKILVGVQTILVNVCLQLYLVKHHVASYFKVIEQAIVFCHKVGREHSFNQNVVVLCRNYSIRFDILLVNFKTCQRYCCVAIALLFNKLLTNVVANVTCTDCYKFVLVCAEELMQVDCLYTSSITEIEFYHCVVCIAVVKNDCGIPEGLTPSPPPTAVGWELKKLTN